MTLRRAAPPLLVLAALVLYWSSLGGPFVWDDNNLIRDNSTVTSLRHIPRAFTADIGRGSAVTYIFYRPLQTVSYITDHALWGLSPAGYRLTNVLWHAVAALAAYALILTLFGSVSGAFVAALLFVAHPVQTEAVAYIAGRADPMSAAFLFLGLLAWDRHAGSGSRRSFVLTVLCYVASVFSKESGLVLPILGVFQSLCLRRRVPVALAVTLAALAAGYAALRLTAFAGFLAFETGQGGVLDRLPGSFAAWASYLRLLAWPSDLHMEYGLRRFGWAQTSVGMGAALAVCSLILFARSRGKESVPVRWGIGWLFLALLPVSNLFLLNAYMAEHWLYVPSLGFLTAFVFGVLGAAKPLGGGGRAAVRLFFGACFMILAVLTVRQSAVWADPARLYERTLRYSPDSFGVRLNLGQLYQEKGEYAKALASYEEADRLKPDHYFTWFLRGALYHAMGRVEDALGAYRRSVELNEGYAAAHNNLAVIYFMRGEFREALEHGETVTRLGSELHPGFQKKLIDIKLGMQQAVKKGTK